MEGRTSRIGTVKPVGRPLRAGRAEREVGLCHADGQVAVALLFEGRNLRLGLGQVVHAGRAVDPRGDGLDLLLDGGVEVVEELEVRGLFAGGHDCLGEFRATLAAPRVDVTAHRGAGSGLQGDALDGVQLSLSVIREGVDRHDHRQAEDFIFSMCFTRFCAPSSSAGTFSFSISSLGGFLPGGNLKASPCIFSALAVATMTTQLGCMLPTRHLMSRNFSAPQSAPKPASVTT